jgi:hypothetical protein
MPQRVFVLHRTRRACVNAGDDARRERPVVYSTVQAGRAGASASPAAILAWLARPEAGFVTRAVHTIDAAFGA